MTDRVPPKVDTMPDANPSMDRCALPLAPGIGVAKEDTEPLSTTTLV